MASIRRRRAQLSEADDTLAPSPASGGWRRALRITRRYVLPVLGWAWAVGGAALAVSLILGLALHPVLLALQGMQFLVLAPCWLVLGAAAVRRRRVQGALAVIAVLVHLWFSVPAAVSAAAPSWTVGAPRVSLFVANVRYRNPDPKTVARRIVAADADVVVVLEVTPRLRAAFDEAGLTATYRWRSMTPDDGRFGDMVMSRLPARDVGLVRAGPIVVPSLTVDVGGRRVRVHAVHAPNPSPVSRLDRWRSGLAALRRLAERDGGAVVFAGDFNASGFHRAYRSMLGGGLSDAHDERGLGLTPSWGPESNPLPWPDALIRLDHAAYSGSIYPVALQNGEMPGSDHRPFAVTFAVRPRR